MKLALRKPPTKLGVGEEHMTPSTFWFHYLDRNSVVPAAYPASLLYRMCRCHHSEEGTQLPVLLWKWFWFCGSWWIHSSHFENCCDAGRLDLGWVKVCWLGFGEGKVSLRKWFLSQAKEMCEGFEVGKVVCVIKELQEDQYT